MKTFDILIKATIQSDRYTEEEISAMLIVALADQYIDEVIIDDPKSDEFRVVEYHKTTVVSTTMEEPYQLH